jgi:hypothetical protein
MSASCGIPSLEVFVKGNMHVKQKFPFYTIAQDICYVDAITRFNSGNSSSRVEDLGNGDGIGNPRS